MIHENFKQHEHDCITRNSWFLWKTKYFSSFKNLIFSYFPSNSNKKNDIEVFMNLWLKTDTKNVMETVFYPSQCNSSFTRNKRFVTGFLILENNSYFRYIIHLWNIIWQNQYRELFMKWRDIESFLESGNRADQHQELSKYVNSSILFYHKQNNEKLSHVVTRWNW